MHRAILVWVMAIAIGCSGKTTSDPSGPIARVDDGRANTGSDATVPIAGGMTQAEMSALAQQQRDRLDRYEQPIKRWTTARVIDGVTVGETSPVMVVAEAWRFTVSSTVDGTGMVIAKDATIGGYAQMIADVDGSTVVEVGGPGQATSGEIQKAPPLNVVFDVLVTPGNAPVTITIEYAERE